MQKRNTCLDVFKGIASIAVVLLHVRLPFSTLDGVIQCLARFAVPLFFMISGYYCWYDDVAMLLQKLPSKISHIFRICMISFLYWFVVQISVNLFGADDHNLIATLKEMASVKSVLLFLICNVPPVNNILWFLFALLYTYILVYFFAKLDKMKALLFVTPLLLLVHFCAGNIAYACGIHIPKELYRNCWFMGLPLFMIGYYLRENDCFHISKNSARNWIVIGFALSFAEWLLIGGRQQMYVGSMIAAASMICYSARVPEKMIWKPLYLIGNKYSLFIYVTHISVGIAIDKVAKLGHFINTSYYASSKPFLVILSTVFFSIAFYRCKDKLSCFMKNRKV